jgi:hypothetical protein
MLGFKSFVSAAATLAGIETANMIRKGVNGGEKVCHWAEQKSSTVWVTGALANALPNSWRLPRRLGPPGPIFSVF